MTRREIRDHKLSDQAERCKEGVGNRNILKTRDDNTGVNPDNSMKHFGELFTILVTDYARLRCLALNIQRNWTYIL